MSIRKVFVGGNHKCNGSVTATSSRARLLAEAAPDLPSSDDVDIVIAPPAPYILTTKAVLDEHGSSAAVALQDVAIAREGGAHTGTVAADMAADLGAAWVIVGHSERRHVYGESDAHTRAKIAAVLDADLGLIYCVGETLEQREGGDAFGPVAAQMAALFDNPALATKPELWANIVVAYEPVWAIGTGKVASPEQAQEIHTQLRAAVAAATSPDIAAAVRIIYGGSVKLANCAELIAMPDIDGFLIGGASLKPEFVDIIKTAAAAGASA
ncbi:triosephosphate isomerase [Thecamonas trahens ATCC 50062]|uniref:Triosephosphate isomerase n=1 Tax=Thecamonas trahens ATCC 50062 TaxID=461836 RepID=A0A0L0DY21_THETB|nr:triosephosphate isomerase [Thecamonas trahens ATCC 50062]KNC56448.1 triosephosphate isomerase [Thecamonas trahens ATCC 50062]|eukprot:XP_013760960.1 triosephosphate isomerase [Thecamonas trahens ATCC 50062]